MGDTFSILARGEVRVSQRHEGGGETVMRDMTEGDYFGEMVCKLRAGIRVQSSVQALLKTELRTTNVIALSEIVDCLALDREYEKLKHLTKKYHKSIRFNKTYTLD